jgi:hypothetical protein
MYDTITPEQWVIGIVISLLTFGGLVWLLWHYFPHDGGLRGDMSSSASDLSSEKAGDGPVSHQVPKPVFVSAEPNTDDTAPVSSAAGASVIDTNARAIIRASLIAELLDSGLLTNRDKAICQAFHCSKAASTRPDAPFQVALRLVEQHRTKRQPEYVGEMIERVKRKVAEEASS